LARVTSLDIARAAGVSQSTVSRILNDRAPALVTEQTRERVFRLARELNYVPNAAARQLRRRTARAIGLIFPPAAHNVTALYSFAQMFSGIAEAVEAAGYALVLCPSITAERAIQMQHVGQVDGALIILPLVDDPRVRGLLEVGAPLVSMNQMPDEAGLPWVDFDNVGSSRSAVQHLIARGRRRIGFLGWGGLVNTQLRLRGYLEALAAAGLADDSALIKLIPEPLSLAQGTEAMQSLLSLPCPPSAVFCGGDLLAVGMVHAAQARGLSVPQDVAVVGFDDEPASAYLTPALTTVRPPFRTKGRCAAKMIIDLVEGREQNPAGVLLEAELIVRDSS
jgi:DNA-binding LacI/PurR family transcriptional regulator